MPFINFQPSSPVSYTALQHNKHPMKKNKTMSLSLVCNCSHQLHMTTTFQVTFSFSYRCFLVQKNPNIQPIVRINELPQEQISFCQKSYLRSGIFACLILMAPKLSNTITILSCNLCNFFFTEPYEIFNIFQVRNKLP